jgi:transcriptional regulator with XRE-family HTH domain
MIDNVYDLHSRIRELRKNNEMTQKQIADYLEVEVSTYAHYEKGDRTPDAKKLARLATLYGLKDELLGVQMSMDQSIMYKDEDVKRFKDVLKKCKWRKGDYKWNLYQYELLEGAAAPIIDARKKALELPDIDINIMETQQNVFEVKVDRYVEALIDRYRAEICQCVELMVRHKYCD